MRRRRRGLDANTLGKRTTLGTFLRDGTNKVAELNYSVAKATIPFDYDADTVLSWLFPAETLNILRAAYPVSQPQAKRVHYTVAPNVDLFIDLEKTRGILAPQPTCLRIDPVTARPLLNTIAEIRKVYEAFAVVEYVMKWMDGNATPGAIRYYWPTILSLVPDCQPLQIDSPARFVEPSGIAPLLPLIREASNTVAAALLLPAEETAKTPSGLSLWVSGEFRRDSINISTEPKTYTI